MTGAGGAVYYEPDEHGTLRSTCWCGAKFVAVHASLVRKGETVSCGRADCEPEQP